MGIRTMLRARRDRHADLLLALLAAKPEGRYGAEMWYLSGVPSGAMYIALARLEREGLLVTSWAEQEGHRPQRRLYQVTPAGRIAAEGTRQPR